MTGPAPGRRRAQLRAAMVADIKRTARRQLVDGGAAAISLRAIAREVGLSAAGMYRYYPSLDAIVADLIADLYDELRRAIEQARDAAVPGEEQAAGDGSGPGAERIPGDAVARLPAMARAFRRWSVAHPAEFALVFGSPIQGLSVFSTGPEPVVSAGIRFGAAFFEVFLRLWEQRLIRLPDEQAVHPEFAAGFAPPLAGLAAQLPAGLVYLVLTMWTRLYGLVAMEVFGQLQWATRDVEPLFEMELTAQLRALSLGDLAVERDPDSVLAEISADDPNN